MNFNLPTFEERRLAQHRQFQSSMKIKFPLGKSQSVDEDAEYQAWLARDPKNAVLAEACGH